MPLNPYSGSNTKQDDYRELFIVPFVDKGEVELQIFDDDGESFGYLEDNYLLINCHLICDENSINLKLNRSGAFSPKYDVLHFKLPKNESRVLFVNGKRLAPEVSVPLSEINCIN